MVGTTASRKGDASSPINILTPKGGLQRSRTAVITSSAEAYAVECITQQVLSKGLRFEVDIGCRKRKAAVKPRLSHMEVLELSRNLEQFL